MTDSEVSSGTGDLARAGLVVGGRFTLVQRIGGGGTGEVFEAEDNRIRRRVALKVLHPQYARDPEVSRRFQREARAAASIEHPNSIVIHDFGQRRDGSFFIVQELLRGVDLRARIKERKHLTLPETFEIMAPVMGALVVAHRKGVVHRDIKPENIFLARSATGETVPKVIDYGIALAPETLTIQVTTQGKGLLGTLLYMAPEQAKGEPIDQRADVWAVGTVLFELLTGDCPFRAPTAFAVVNKLFSSDPAPRVGAVASDVPEELAAIVDRALHRDLGQRFPSMEDFLRALLRFISRTDPGFAGRHPASLPPLDEIELHSEDCEPLVPPVSSRRPLASARPLARPDMEWYVDVVAPTVADWGSLAEQALRVNALDDAITHAERALAQGVSGERRGHLRLVQAIAGRWLGRFTDAEQWARQALEDLPPASTGWYSAIGHLALACGAVGKNDELPGLTRQISLAAAGQAPSGAHVIALNRLIIQLVRAGELETAQRLSAEVQDRSRALADVDAVVQAWIDVGTAELALHVGDLSTYLQKVELAVLGFAEAGDPRNACLQRANIGNAYLQLGAYRQAEQMLLDALTVGKPMNLQLIGPAQVNLGLTIARLGDLDEALEIETTALALCARLGHRRYDAVARIYLAEIHRLRGDLAAAEEEARRAVATPTAPALRAYAVATLAHMLLGLGRQGEALSMAREAMLTLQSLEGVEEGESLIQLVHVLALEANGHRAQAVEHARDAMARLAERASKIAEPGLRRAFLEKVPENARLRALVRAP